MAKKIVWFGYLGRCSLIWVPRERGCAGNLPWEMWSYLKQVFLNKGSNAWFTELPVLTTACKYLRSKVAVFILQYIGLTWRTWKKDESPGVRIRWCHYPIQGRQSSEVRSKEAGTNFFFLCPRLIHRNTRTCMNVRGASLTFKRRWRKGWSVGESESGRVCNWILLHGDKKNTVIQGITLQRTLKFPHPTHEQ